MALKIAITGNIASGKSLVEHFIKELGYTVYDTDKISHDILDEIKDFYEYDVFTDGKIDRNKLGELVFGNKDLKIKLEQIIHPKVKDKIIEIFNKHRSDKFIFISVPLLYEAGFEYLFDKILLITVPDDIRKKRLMARDGISGSQAEIRIKSQLPETDKIKKADFVISNDSTKEILKMKVLSFINNILN